MLYEVRRVLRVPTRQSLVLWMLQMDHHSAFTKCEWPGISQSLLDLVFNVTNTTSTTRCTLRSDLLKIYENFTKLGSVATRLVSIGAWIPV